MEQLLSIKEVAGILGVHPMTIYDMTYYKQIEYVKVGGRKLIKKSTLENYIEENTVRREVI